MSRPLPRVIAALHLLPSAVSRHPQAQPLNRIIDHALHHAHIAYQGGVRGFYIQDVHDTPVAPAVQPETVSNLTAVAKQLRAAFPDAALGICLMQHAAREPLQICADAGGDFVRIKVYVGVMVKAEGVLTGCAYEAIQTRAALGAGHIRILADVYDRVGVPLAPLPLGEAARQAVVFGKADALVITGNSAEHTVQMLDEVNAAHLNVPLVVGGSVSVANLAEFEPRAQHFIVHAAFCRPDLPDHKGLPVDWHIDSVKGLMMHVP